MSAVVLAYLCVVFRALRTSAKLLVNWPDLNNAILYDVLPAQQVASMALS